MTISHDLYVSRDHITWSAAPLVPRSPPQGSLSVLVLIYSGAQGERLLGGLDCCTCIGTLIPGLYLWNGILSSTVLWFTCGILYASWRSISHYELVDMNWVYLCISMSNIECLDSPLVGFQALNFFVVSINFDVDPRRRSSFSAFQVPRDPWSYACSDYEDILYLTDISSRYSLRLIIRYPFLLGNMTDSPNEFEL